MATSARAFRVQRAIRPTWRSPTDQSVSMGKALGTRNAPTVFNAGRMSVIFWDGRADSLWSQPLFAIENPVEMASSRLALAHYVADTPALQALYVQTFSAAGASMPDLTGYPPTGKPGDPSFDTLSSQQQDTVNRIAANVGKALQAYMRLNSAGPAPLDAYLSGDGSAMNLVALQGLGLFVTAGCIDCHSGPMLTDQGFHQVALPSLPGAAHDPGRAGALAILQANVFNLEGPYADLTPSDGFVAPPEPANPDGAFRTPSLRNVTETAPYGHDGALASLTDVLAVHAPTLTATEQAELIAFFRTLTGQEPPRPWSTWPAPQWNTERFAFADGRPVSFGNCTWNSLRSIFRYRTYRCGCITYTESASDVWGRRNSPLT